ncbi:MAG: hypothetical protein ACRBHB_09710 [Arenicella sp.]
MKKNIWFVLLVVVIFVAALAYLFLKYSPKENIINEGANIVSKTEISLMEVSEKAKNIDEDYIFIGEQKFFAEFIPSLPSIEDKEFVLENIKQSTEHAVIEKISKIDKNQFYNWLSDIDGQVYEITFSENSYSMFPEEYFGHFGYLTKMDNDNFTLLLHEDMYLKILDSRMYQDELASLELIVDLLNENNLIDKLSMSEMKELFYLSRGESSWVDEYYFKNIKRLESLTFEKPDIAKIQQMKLGGKLILIAEIDVYDKKLNKTYVDSLAYIDGKWQFYVE